MKGSRKKKRAPMTRRKPQREAAPPITTSFSECCFCKDVQDPELGTFFQDEGVNLAAHQFCLLFSCGLPQAGSDQDGFEGFLFPDILKEVRRVRRIVCKYCLKYGASCGCFIKSCPITYHYKCGIVNNAQFDFHGTFNTFCVNHRSFQDMSYILNGSHPPTCPSCLDVIDGSTSLILKMPCCKNVFAHKECVQNQAMASGYFFRCPTCKNEKLFKREMQKYGIYIPLRDASWEENNAFSDLLQQYQMCDIPSCKCPMGKNYEDENGKWELIRCYHCGQGAVHRQCLGKRYISFYGYICRDCNEVAGLLKAFTFSPEKSKEQTLEQKRLIQEHIAKGDPLCMSLIQRTPSETCDLFNIKPCRVEIKRLPKSLISKFEEQSLSLDFAYNDERRLSRHAETTPNSFDSSLDTAATVPDSTNCSFLVSSVETSDVICDSHEVPLTSIHADANESPKSSHAKLESAKTQDLSTNSKRKRRKHAGRPKKVHNVGVVNEKCGLSADSGVTYTNFSSLVSENIIGNTGPEPVENMKNTDEVSGHSPISKVNLCKESEMSLYETVDSKYEKKDNRYVSHVNENYCETKTINRRRRPKNSRKSRRGLLSGNVVKEKSTEYTNNAISDLSDPSCISENSMTGLVATGCLYPGVLLEEKGKCVDITNKVSKSSVIFQIPTGKRVVINHRKMRVKDQVDISGKADVKEPNTNSDTSKTSRICEETVMDAGKVNGLKVINSGHHTNKGAKFRRAKNNDENLEVFNFINDDERNSSKPGTRMILSSESINIINDPGAVMCFNDVNVERKEVVKIEDSSDDFNLLSLVKSRRRACRNRRRVCASDRKLRTAGIGESKCETSKIDAFGSDVDSPNILKNNIEKCDSKGDGRITRGDSRATTLCRKSKSIRECRGQNRESQDLKSKRDSRSKITFYISGNTKSAVEATFLCNKSKRRKKKMTGVDTKNTSIDDWLQKSCPVPKIDLTKISHDFQNGGIKKRSWDLSADSITVPLDLKNEVVKKQCLGHPVDLNNVPLPYDEVNRIPFIKIEPLDEDNDISPLSSAAERSADLNNVLRTL